MTLTQTASAAALPRRGVACAILALLLPVAAVAQTTPAAPAPDPLTLARYDKNGNGRLDPDEVAAMNADQAQAAAAVTVDPKASAPAGDVVVMSPFQVDTSRDNGYYGANTLSGTRLNSNVEDLGSSITVVTKQQLEDTAAVDINDVFRYEANTEGTYDYTAVSTSTPTSDQIQQNPGAATRVRGIGSPNRTVDYFTTSSRIPVDTYNIGSVEISRGPNSIIAGLGSPAGTVNVNRDEALVSRSTNTVQLRLDDLGGYRTSINVNRPIVQDRLAIRVAALYGNNKYKQKPSYDQVKRLYAALTAKPFDATTIKLKAEVYHEQRQTPNSLTPRDGVTEWVNSGEPTWNPLTWTATVNGQQVVVPYSSTENQKLPAGLYVNSTTYTRPSMYIDNGQVQYWEVNRLSTGANPNANITSNARMISSGSAYMRGTVNGGTLYTTPGISNKALYDWTSVNATPTNWNYDHAASYTAEIDQKIIDHLYFRGAWHLEDVVDYNRNIANPPTLTIDVNQYLLNGQPNPYFLRPYILNIEPTIFRSPEYHDAVQASLGYDLDLRQRHGLLSWLGYHQIGLNYENRRDTTGTFRYREAIIDPNHVWDTAGALNYTNGAAIGRPSYQFYVGPAGALGYTKGFTPPKSGVAGNYNLNWYNGVTKQWVSDPATFGTAPYVSSMTRTQDTAKSFSWQGKMLKDHLVLTGGIRNDDYQTRNSASTAVDPVTGYYTTAALRTWNPWTYASGYTRYISGVLYPFKSHVFGLTYSKASSFQPQPQAVDLFGTVLPNTYAHGHDYGVQFNLLNDKLIATLKFYKDTVANDRTSNSTIGTRIARVEAGTYMPGTGSDRMSLYYWAHQKAMEQLGPNATQDQIDAAAAKITQFPQGFQSALAANLSGAAIRGTADTEGKGAELEISYNPSYNWNFRFNAAKTEALNTSIENNLADYIASRMPYWLSVKDANGVAWWTDTEYTSQSAKAFYDSAVTLPLKLDQALLGKSNPQVKKYSWRMLTTYRFTQGVLKDSSVGGSIRWDDKSVIGYLAGAPDSDGIVRTLDVNRGVYDPARYQADFWIGYKMKLFHDRVSATYQLNVINAFEHGGLRAIGVNPDGQVYNWRIINPRQFVLTTRFDF